MKYDLRGLAVELRQLEGIDGLNQLVVINAIDALEKLDTELMKINSRKCRICGCSQLNACQGGCYWVSKDLCSQCVRYSNSDIDPLESLNEDDL